VDAVGAEDVGDLVRVGDDRRGAVREDRPRELVDHELGRLDVHVGVDEPRHEVGALDVDALPALVAPETHDVAIDDRHVGVEPLLGEDRQHPPAGQHGVGRLVASCDSHPARVDDGQA